MCVTADMVLNLHPQRKKELITFCQHDLYFENLPPTIIEVVSAHRLI